MPESSVYEYAVVRLVPSVEREEFINVGVILYCPKQAFLDMLFWIDTKRMSAFGDEMDVVEIQNHLKAWQRICIAGQRSGPIGQLATGERFRWLTATRSTILQTSKVHIGYCKGNPGETLRHLFDTLVTPLKGD